MINPRTEYIITETGAVEQRIIYTNTVRTPQAAVSLLCANAAVRVHSILPGVNISFLDHAAWATCRLSEIQIDTNWRTTTDDFVVPAYGDANRPSLRLPWIPPDDMKLYLFARLVFDDGEGNWNRTEHVYLVAIDEADPTKTYRLPLANIHNNAQVCMGQRFKNDFAGPLLTNIEKIILWFQNSKYNSDLADDSNRSRSADLFRFKPGMTSFDQQPCADWRPLVTPVGVDLFQHLIP